MRGDTLLVARFLPEGPNLTAEVRRNIAVYTAQSSRHVVSCLYLAGGGDNGIQPESLQKTLGIPVRCFDPFTAVEGKGLPEQNRGAFAGAMGLLHVQSSGRRLPINFVSPKQAEVARDPNKRRLTVAAGMAALLLFGVVTYCYSDLAALDNQIDALEVKQKSLDVSLPKFQEEQVRLKELDDWSRSNLCWLDELYNLTALVPKSGTLRAYEIKGSTQPPAKDKPIAQLDLKLGSRDAGGDTVNRYLEKMEADKHYRPATKMYAGDFKDPSFPGQFTAHVDVENQPPDNYQLHVTAASATQPPPWGPRGRSPAEANPPGLARPEHGGWVKYHLPPATETGPKHVGMPSQNRASPIAPKVSSPQLQQFLEQGAQQMPNPGGEIKPTSVDPSEMQRRRQEQREKRLKDSGRPAPASASVKEKGKS